MRRQLPVHSPVTLSAVLAGLSGALGRDGHAQLQNRLRSAFSPLDVLLTNSGTSALMLALGAIASERDGLIALPAYNCFDLATAADGARVRAILYDVDPATLAPDERSFKRALSHAPRAVVIANLYGVPIDIPQFRLAAEYAGAIVIEDAAQGIGVSFDDAPAGSMGSLGILSFGRGKGISGGAGGALLANDDVGAALVRSMCEAIASRRAGWSELARATSQWLLGRPRPYGLISRIRFLKLGETIYKPPPTPSALSRSSERIVANVWQAAHDEVAARRAAATALQDHARGSGLWRTIDVPNEGTAGWLRVPLLPARMSRDVILTEDAKRLGVMPGYPLPLSLLGDFADRCVNAHDRFPGAELLAAQLLTLPAHSLLSARDMNDLIRWLEWPVPDS